MLPSPVSDLFLALVPPSLAELGEAMPVILSLVVIEGLLSVDNALAIAAMASHLPGKQKYLALKFGIIGAYLFRGLSLAFAAWIIENPWLKIGGSAYLVYLMATHFADPESEGGDESGGASGGRGFVMTIVAIEIMDLSLSVDNVVAAVAMSPKLWVVCAGVFIGILALRFVAGACIRLIERMPILEHTAFLLIGYVGCILAVEVLSDPQCGFAVFSSPIHVTSLQKFAGIVAVIAVSILYSRHAWVRTAFKPVLAAGLPVLKAIAAGVGAVLGIVGFPFRMALRVFRGKRDGTLDTDTGAGPS